MKGIFYIDGLNVSQLYGFVLSEGSYASLLAYPPLKEPEMNSWAEYSGIEVDLLAPKLDAVTRRLKLCSFRPVCDLQGFIGLLQSKGKSDFTFPDLGITQTLRYMGCTGIDVGDVLECELEFCEDEPLKGYTFQAPIAGNIPNQGLQLDGVDISAYNLQLLDGSANTLLKPSMIKPGLSITSRGITGQRTSMAPLSTQSRDVTLKLFMKCTSVNFFVRNYYSFLHDLVKPGERELVYGLNGLSLKFFYKNSSISYFSIDGSVWCEFDVNVCITNG